MRKKFNNLTVELFQGNIINQPDFDAIVNAANSELRTGGGIAGAIHGKGDPELERMTRPHAPISPGEAVITPAPHLPNKNVIHCLGPVYGKDEPSDKLLADCYKNALKRAEENNLKSVAFPAISTGAFGYPMIQAAKVALSTIRDESEKLESVEHVRFVLWSDQDMEIHQEVLDEI